MTFKGTILEIDNGFLVETTYMGEHSGYSSQYASTFEGGLAAVVARYKEWHPNSQEMKLPVITSMKEASKKTQKASTEAVKEATMEAAVRYTKLCGLVRKDYSEFLIQFNANFPKQDSDEAIGLAHCRISKGIVVFVGGN